MPPLYVYECPKCKREIEQVQSISQPSLPPICCEEGCNIEMERIISPSTFVLKGGGWARDGYSKKDGGR